MNWIYIIIAVSLALLFFTGSGESLAQGSGTSKEVPYTDFKAYIDKGYAQNVVINKTDNTLRMYVKPKFSRNVFNYSAQQKGNKPYLTV